MGVLRFADGRDDLRVRREFASGQRRQDCRVVAVRGHDDGGGMLGARKSQHVGSGRVTAHGHQPLGGSVVEHCLVTVHHNDFRGLLAVGDHRLDCCLALGPVPDHHGVITHLVPPTLNFESLTGSLGQDFQRGADQHDQEHDA